MAVPDENPTTVRETGSSKSSTLNPPEINKVGDSDSETPEKPIETIPDDQYPHGLALALLSGAALIAVFLIALDQVSISPTLSVTIVTVKNTSDRRFH